MVIARIVPPLTMASCPGARVAPPIDTSISVADTSLAFKLSACVRETTPASTTKATNDRVNGFRMAHLPFEQASLPAISIDGYFSRRLILFCNEMLEHHIAHGNDADRLARIVDDQGP